MPEYVGDFECFHVTRDLAYNDHPRLSIGSRLISGEASNPFFSFYEKPKLYGIDTPEGVRQVHAIRFLELVRDGFVNTETLATTAVDIARHFNTLARELLMEAIRLETNAEAPSRQSALWVVDTIDHARVWQNRLGERGRILRLSASGALHRTDASLMLQDSEPLSESREKVIRYWSSDAGTAPEELEILFAGSATVTEEVA